MAMSSTPDNTNINNNAAVGTAAIILPGHQTPLGILYNTQQRCGTGLVYINMYINEMKPFGDDNIMSFEEITPPYIAGDNLQKFMHGFYVWFANKRIHTYKNTWLSTEMKGQYQKRAKQVTKAKFPMYHLFSTEYND